MPNNKLIDETSNDILRVVKSTLEKHPNATEEYLLQCLKESLGIIRSYNNINHYKRCAQWFILLEQYQRDGDTGLSDEAFLHFFTYGFRWSEAVGKLNLPNNDAERLQVKPFHVDLLESLLERWPTFDPPRDWLKEFIICRVNSFRNERHDALVKIQAQDFLREQGCSILATEVKFPNGPKIDVLGHTDDNEIIGVDAKCSTTDLKRSIKNNALTSYLSYCNRLYILTDDPSTFNFAWRLNEYDFKYNLCGKIGGMYCGQDCSNLKTGRHKVTTFHPKSRDIAPARKRDAQCAVFTKYFDEIARKVKFGSENDGLKGAAEILSMTMRFLDEDINRACKCKENIL